MHEHRFIEKPICPLPASPEKILSGVDYILVTHLHADHFSPDFLPPDAPMVFQSQEDAEAAVGAAVDAMGVYAIVNQSGSEAEAHLCELMPAI